MVDTPEVIISNAARFVISYGSVEITSVFNNTFNAWWLKLTLAHILGLRYTGKSLLTIVPLRTGRVKLRWDM